MLREIRAAIILLLALTVIVGLALGVTLAVYYLA